MRNKSALGKGLGALIPPPVLKKAGVEEEKGTVVEIDVMRIVRGEYQPRRSFPEESLNELTKSVMQTGVLQPVLVRKKADGGYMLIAGERRFRAAILAGLKKIPAIVKDVTPGEALQLALIENIQREDLNPMDEAEAYDRLIREFGLTQEQAADKVSKERATVANFLRLLTLPAEIRDDIADDLLNLGHAKAILMLDTPARQLALRREILTRGLSVREAEGYSKRLKAPGRLSRKSHREASAQLTALEDELKRALGTRVRIKHRGRGGKIEIEYYSLEEFERLLEMLRK